jgi:AraC family ethanolamine operon transcriptional activator
VGVRFGALGVAGRARALDRTAELVRYADLGSLSAADLCRAGGVSERTLAYAFREPVGTSPMGFVRRLRIQRVRAQLLMAEPGSITVTAVAHAPGFFEHGQFSAASARAFGELPSETLARRAKDTLI